MDADNNKPTKLPVAVFGCLAFVLGAVLGFFGAFFWSNSQVHMRSGHVVSGGDHRAFLVIGDAFIGAIAGGSVVSVIALIWRLVKNVGSEDQEPPTEN